jgi:ABC-type transport system, involved in lipoprotein release, permease component
MFKIAWRNILRNKRRSALSLSIIVIGVAVLFIFKGYMSHSLNGLTTLALSEYGNLEIAADGYWNNNSDERHLLTETDIVKIKKILNGNRTVHDFSTQLSMFGFIGNETKSVIISGQGIEPGKYQNNTLSVTDGNFLAAGDTDQVVLGDGIRQKLGAKKGEWLSIVTTTLDGANNAGNLQVKGAFSMHNNDADNAFIILPLVFAQNLLNTGGVDKFIVHLSDDSLTGSTIMRLSKQFREARLKVEIKRWEELAAYFRQVRSWLQAVFFVTALIIFILVFFSILEIMFMSFFERMNEIGTIRAIGTQRSQVFSLLTLEGLILGVFGGLMGVGLGYAAGFLINALKISYAAPGFNNNVSFTINLTFNNGIQPFITVVIAIMISASYPAFKAAKLNIADILRHA